MHLARFVVIEKGRRFGILIICAVYDYTALKVSGLPKTPLEWLLLMAKAIDSNLHGNKK